MIARTSTPELVLRNGAQLFFCFAGSALLNVISQAFFAAHAPADKDAWLSATLLAGTIAAALGVLSARRFGFATHPRALGVALVATSAALFGGTFLFASPAAFALASIGQRFLVQYGTQELDRRAVALSGAVDRRRNDVIGLGMRFGGMLIGPLWFGLARDPGAATVAATAALAALGLVTAWRLAGAPDAVPRAVAAPHAEPEDAADRALVVGARLIYAACFLLASSMVYVLGDLHHVPSPARAGGLLVTLVYGSAIVATVIEMARPHPGRRSPLAMLPAALAALAVGLALPLPAAAHTGPQAAGAILIGASFARYQLAFRDHATHAALHRDRPGLLAAYNNLASTSALVGYAAMAAIVGVCRAIGVPFARGAGLGVALLGAAAVPFVLAGARGAAVTPARVDTRPSP